MPIARKMSTIRAIRQREDDQSSGDHQMFGNNSTARQHHQRDGRTS